MSCVLGMHELIRPFGSDSLHEITCYARPASERMPHSARRISVGSSLFGSGEIARADADNFEGLIGDVERAAQHAGIAAEAVPVVSHDRTA